MNKQKTILTIILTCIILFGFSLSSYIRPIDEYSDSERRPLSGFPELSIDTVINGKFMNNFEDYTTDQFPLRDSFRSLKAFFSYYVFNQTDNNDLISKDNYLTKIEYPLNEKLIYNASAKFNSIYNTYLKDNQHNIYLSIIPDKNYYLLDNNHLKMDYNKLIDIMTNNDYMHYIDIFPLLSVQDYYYTDTHWKQENIIDIAEHLCLSMNNEYKDTTYTSHTINDHVFKGVYTGQYSLKCSNDYLTYLTSETIDQCKVYSYSTAEKKEIDMYNLDKAYGKDGYEMYLNGTEALLTIENPLSDTDKELIIFRDSFTSALAPLLIENYSKITLVDIRYIAPVLIKDYIDFNNQDILFLYSTILLNNSSAFQ